MRFFCFLSVIPTRIELISYEPESYILSIELRNQNYKVQICNKYIALANVTELQTIKILRLLFYILHRSSTSRKLNKQYTDRELQ